MDYNILYTMAKENLAISLPIQFDELKAAFKRAVKNHHPDVGGSKEDFVRLKEVYDTLASFKSDRNIFLQDHAVVQEEHTLDGYKLSELGLGLPWPMNADECSSCQGHGYKETAAPMPMPSICRACDSQGYVQDYPNCRPCHGTGRFTKPNQKSVECRVCHGDGKFKKYKKRLLCKSCAGVGTLLSFENKKHYLSCSTCSGLGEVEIVNPVLPRSAILVG